MVNQSSEAHENQGPDMAIEVKDLEKSFRMGLSLKKVDAVRGISFRVNRGEVFGFLGPNGAGKTTTIKMAMGLVRPSRGSIQVLGKSIQDRAIRQRIGYLPEHPYFHDYLTPIETLNFYGRLFGLRRAERKAKIHTLLDRVGLNHAKDRTLRKFSKGMLQRLGIAQALLNDPDLLVLDEPLSGLDPIGRKEIRDILVEQRAAGKTIFFSSHILSDIEVICENVAIIQGGKIRSSGRLEELLNPDRNLVEVTFRGASSDMLTGFENEGFRVDRLGEYNRVVVEGSVDKALAKLVSAGVEVQSVIPKRESLEDLFVKESTRSEKEDKAA